MAADEPLAKGPRIHGWYRYGPGPFDVAYGYLDEVDMDEDEDKDEHPGKSKQTKDPSPTSSHGGVHYPHYPIGATWPKSRSSMTSPRSSCGARFARPEQSKPPLWAAVEEKDEHAVRTLLSWGEDVNERYKAWTPLMKAAEEGSRAILHLLVERSASINASNSRGRTALSFAAAPSMRRPTQLLTLAHLLTAGADITLQDNNGLTARGWAEKELRWDAVAMLSEFESTGQLDVFLEQAQAGELADSASTHD